jgi:DNA (cytosine-5)-methyltransferase 1
VSKKNSLGKKHGFLDRTQGTLFFDIVRIINEKRPKAFLLENVKNLKSHDKGRTYKTIKETLDALDYEVFDNILDGKYYVPQHRKRILIVGFDRKAYGKNIWILINLYRENLNLYKAFT